jgi:hypothetical protein
MACARRELVTDMIERVGEGDRMDTSCEVRELDSEGGKGVNETSDISLAVS